MTGHDDDGKGDSPHLHDGKPPHAHGDHEHDEGCHGSHSGHPHVHGSEHSGQGHEGHSHPPDEACTHHDKHEGHSHPPGEACDHHHYRPSPFVKSWYHVSATMAGIVGIFALGMTALTRGWRKDADRADEKQRTEDVAYTINHAVACTATDVVDPFIGNATQKYLGKRISIGCGHDHSSHLKEWVVGETAGDLGAVLATVGILRFAPGIMTGIEHVTTPLLGPLFHAGAVRATNAWAAEQHIDKASPEYKAHLEATYQYELRHLPQALSWTASSIAINLATQRMVGNTAPLWHMATGKAIGAGISAGLLVAGRAVVPDAAHRWDQFTNDKLFAPTTSVIGRWLGIEKSAPERWTEKLAEEKEAAPEEAVSRQT